MLLQVILEKLDQELNRLLTLRDIVSSLDTPASKILAQQILEEQVHAEAAEPAAVVPAPEKVAVRRGRAYMPRGPRVKRTQHEETALARAVPSAPVVVLPAALAREREARVAKPAARQAAPEMAPKSPVGSLGALIRSLEIRTATP